MDIEAAIRTELVAEVVDEAEAITTTGVGEEAVLVEVEVATTEVEGVAKEQPINRLTMWAPVVVATTHREGSQITMIMYRVGTIIMRPFLPWAAAEAYLMASKSVCHLLVELQVRAGTILRTLDEMNRWTTGALH